MYDVIMKVKDQDGEMYDIMKDPRGGEDLVAMSSNPEETDEDGPYDFDPKTMTILGMMYGDKKVMKVEDKQEVEETQVEQVQEIEEVDEVAESIAKLKAMAGVGSKARSNHGIHEGEEGYQLTPRSIVARQMRKLQDIERG